MGDTLRHTGRTFASFFSRRQALGRLERACVETLESRYLLTSTVVPVAGATGVIYDPTRNDLYVTTDSGALARYDLDSQQLLTPIQVGARLQGGDITPDGKYLYIADYTGSAIRKVDLSTGEVANLSIGQAPWDLAIGADNKAWVMGGPFQIDLATDAVSYKGELGSLGYRSIVARSADRRTVFIEEQDAPSNTTLGLYDCTSGTFIKRREQESYIGSTNAVNRDGSLVWNGFLVMDRDLQPVRDFKDMAGANAFNPVLDILYTVDRNTDQIIAYDTNTWQERYRLNAGVGSLGYTMAFSDDGARMFFATRGALSIVDLPQSDGQARTQQISGFHPFVKPGVQGQLTVAFRDASGEPARNFRGTVHFSSSDPTATLPADYTFTAADAGSHVFAATLNSIGTQGITATVVGGTLAATQSGIVVHAPGASFVPMTGQQDMVFDSARHQLYITTGDGLLQRYDVDAEMFLAPWKVGGSLLSADITPDGNYLYVTDHALGVSAIRKIDLATGQLTTISHPLVPWDLRISADGKAMVTGDRASDYGGVEVQQIDLATDTLGPMSPAKVVYQKSVIARSADYRTLFIEELHLWSNTLSLYDSVTGTFVATTRLNEFLDGRNAVSRDGAMIALNCGGALTVMDRSFQTLQTFGSLPGGFAFDPVRDLFYEVDPDTDQVIAYDTATWQERFRLGIGEDVQFITDKFGRGQITFSDDGKTLFLTTATGIRVLALPQPDGQAVTGEISGFPSFVKTGIQGSFTVSFRDTTGGPATQFRGTVHFTSSDPRAVLPADYTFTAADAGSHSFTATLSTGGFQDITARVVGSSLTASQQWIGVHYPHTSVVPVGAAAIVYDPTRNQLLITNGGGALQRYDLETETLLPEWQVGLSLLGEDITADGKDLYVADIGAKVIRKVDLDTGAVTTLPHGAWNVTVNADGTALYTESLIRVDLVTDTNPGYPSLGTSYGYIIARSADRSTLFVVDMESSSGGVELYSPQNDSHFAGKSLYASLGGFGAVNRDGSLVAMNYRGIEVMDRALLTVRHLGGFTGGFGFNPMQDQFYAVDANADQIVAYDTHTWEERYRLNIGMRVGGSTIDGFGHGFMTFSADGSRMFLSTNEGVAILTLPQSDGNATSGALAGFPVFVKAGAQGTFTLAFRDRAGAPAKNFRGTVHFTSTDPDAILPEDYTFTAADQGSHSFAATLQSAGTWSITATIVGTSLAIEQTGIAVHVPSLAQLPVAGPQDLILDPTRNILYITTASGLLQRYDLASETLLAPWNVGVSLFGGDITPDGKYLYVADTGARAVVKVDLSSGAVLARVPFPALPTEVNPWDLRISADGRALVTGMLRNLSGGTDLYQIDLTTDSVNTRSDVDGLYTGSNLARSGDHRTLFVEELGSSSCTLALYDSATDRLVASSEVFSGYLRGSNAVNRDGSLVAIRYQGLTVMDRNLATVHTFANLTGGFGFDPTHDVLYGIDPATDQIVAYDTNTWQELYRRSIGEDAQSAERKFSAGMIGFSADGSEMFLVTGSGIRILGLKTPDSRPTAALATSYFAQKGSSITLDGSGSSYDFASLTAYEWDLNYDGTTFTVDATGATPTFSAPSAVGARQIALRVRAADGRASDIATAALYVTNTPPTATFSLIGPAVLGADATVGFTNVAGEGTGFSYSYDFDNDGRFEVVDSASATTTVPASYLATLGVHTVHGRVSDSSHANQDYTISVTVRARPTVTLSAPASAVQGQVVTLVGGATGLQQASGATWEWDFDCTGGSFNVDAQGPQTSLLTATIPADTLRTVAVRVRDGDGAVSDIQSFQIRIMSGGGAAISPSSVLLYSPRPEVQYGDAVTVNLIVTTPDPTRPLPTGTVTFKDGDGAVLGTATLTNGQASFVTTGLQRGYHQITATYAGDSVYRSLDAARPLAVHVGAATVVDVLVLYTPAAAQEISSFGVNIKDLIYAAVADTNDALLNSLINLSLELVDVVQTQYVESGSLASDLAHLRVSGDGYMDEVSALRSSYGADLVCLFVAGGDAGGLAYTMNSTADAENAGLGYSVVVAGQSAGPSYTLAHELGHNFGAVHDVENSEGPGLYDDSYGYRFTGSDGVLYHDIMSYDPGQTVPYYANPAVSYAGVPTGAAGQSNVAGTINASAPVVAGYEPTTVPLVTPTQTMLSIASVPGGQGMLTFTAAVTGLESNPHLPEGTVTFLDGNNVLGTVSLSQGTAALTAALDRGRIHHVRALYSNDDYFGDSVSPAMETSTVPLTITGTQAANVITITAANGQYTINVDGTITHAWIGEVSSITINALGGNDKIDVRGITQAVSVKAGAGNDSIYGSEGNDTLYGDDGDDLIQGNGGDDVISGNWGNDTLDGGDGIDQLMGGLGADCLSGGAGADSIFGGDGTDLIDGNEGDDYIEAKGKADTVHGGIGNDTLWGGAGSDLLYGDAGDDWIDLGYSLFSDSVDGGEGQDCVEVTPGDSNDHFQQTESTVQRPASPVALVLTGTDQADTIRILATNGMYSIYNNGSFRYLWADDVASIQIDAGAGDDLIRLEGSFGQGVTIQGGAGNDTIWSEAGNDQISGDAGDDQITLGDSLSSDTVDGGTGHDIVFRSASDLNDVLKMDTIEEVLDRAAGS